jgi:hypothetical protein
MEEWGAARRGWLAEAEVYEVLRSLRIFAQVGIGMVVNSVSAMRDATHLSGMQARQTHLKSYVAGLMGLFAKQRQGVSPTICVCVLPRN